LEIILDLDWRILNIQERNSNYLGNLSFVIKKNHRNSPLFLGGLWRKKIKRLFNSLPAIDSSLKITINANSKKIKEKFNILSFHYLVDLLIFKPSQFLKATLNKRMPKRSEIVLRYYNTWIS